MISLVGSDISFHKNTRGRRVDPFESKNGPEIFLIVMFDLEKIINSCLAMRNYFGSRKGQLHSQPYSQDGFDMERSKLLKDPLITCGPIKTKL